MITVNCNKLANTLEVSIQELMIQIEDEKVKILNSMLKKIRFFADDTCLYMELIASLKLTNWHANKQVTQANTQRSSLRISTETLTY